MRVGDYIRTTKCWAAFLSAILQEKNLDISYVIQMTLTCFYSNFLHRFFLLLNVIIWTPLDCSLSVLWKVGVDIRFALNRLIKWDSIALANSFCSIVVVSTIPSLLTTVHHGVLTHIFIMSSKSMFHIQTEILHVMNDSYQDI